MYETDMLPVGELVYTDRSFVFTLVSPLYQGQEFIRTANDMPPMADARSNYNVIAIAT